MSPNGRLSANTAGVRNTVFYRGTVSRLPLSVEMAGCFPGRERPVEQRRNEKEVPLVRRHARVAVPHPNICAVPPADRRAATEPHCFRGRNENVGGTWLRHSCGRREESDLQVFSRRGGRGHCNTFPCGDEYAALAVRSDPLQGDVALQLIVPGLAETCARSPRQTFQSSHPQGSIRALVNRGDLVAGQSLAGGEGEKTMPVVTVQPVLSANPEEPPWSLARRVTDVLPSPLSSSKTSKT